MRRTGDIVRRLEDGNILYLNRKDWMVQLNGQRVEPGRKGRRDREYSVRYDITVLDPISEGSGDRRGHI